jgi:hypothetical protein
VHRIDVVDEDADGAVAGLARRLRRRDESEGPPQENQLLAKNVRG